MLPHFQRILRSNDLFVDAFRLRSIPKKKIVIDFSSPNIAKTFHVGNLRSTLYGNFIQKLCRAAGHDVHTINYLGDWGKQFAVLAYYWNIMESKGAEKPSPNEWAQWTARQKVDFLTRSYADGNRLITSNEISDERVRNLFGAMEHIMRCQNTNLQKEMPTSLRINEPMAQNALKLWQEWRQLSTEYLKEFYVRYGVQHNEWEYESDYVDKAQNLSEKLIQDNIAFFTADKLWAIHDRYISGKVVIRKSDNSTLYLSRDLAAIFDRDRRFCADEYMYVVDHSQYRHFAHLKSIVEALGNPELSSKVNHITYGRIIGLSTRLGKTDTVDYLVKEGVAEAKRFIKASPTTRIIDDSTEMAYVTEKLAQAAIIFDLMKRHRATEYTFSFKGAFKVDNNNALLLNEKYSRLCSMEKVNFELMDRVNELTCSDSASFGRLSLELSAPAQNLARQLYEFDTVVVASYDQLEPCILTDYLIKLSVQIGKSMALLRVRGETEDKALPRLFLFMAAKKVLGQGMEMLGIETLEAL